MVRDYRIFEYNVNGSAIKRKAIGAMLAIIDWLEVTIMKSFP